MRLLLILLLLLQPAPPNLTARWDSATSATVRWTQAARGCLYRQPSEGAPVFVSCYEKPGAYTITFGHIGPLSGDLRPQARDVYVLQTSGAVFRAPLMARPLFFPVWRA